MSDNGNSAPIEQEKEKPQFKYIMNIGFNDDGSFAFQTNVPNAVLGYGMLELGKKGVDNHLYQLTQKNKNIVVPKHGIMDFMRGGKL